LEFVAGRATGQVGTLNLDTPWGEQGIASSFYDAAILLNPVVNGDPEQIVSEVSRLLAPEGHLLLLDQTTPEDQASAIVALWKSSLSRLSFTSMAQAHIAREDEAIYIEAIRGSTKPLLNESADTVIEYCAGAPVGLQQSLKELDPANPHTIWAMAKAGIDSNELVGIARVLRKEYPRWDVKTINYPRSISKEVAENMLFVLPDSLSGDAELTFTQQGEVFVPRLVSIPSPASRSSTLSTITNVPARATEIIIRHAILTEGVAVFHGKMGGQTILGLSPEIVAAGTALVDSASLYICPEDIRVSPDNILHLLPGLVVSVLAPSLGLFLQPKQLRTSKILLTHSSSLIARTVRSFYSALELHVVAVEEQSPLTISRSYADESFDIIISGYEDKGSNQMLSLLLKPGGHSFQYASDANSLKSIVRDEPALAGTALRVAFEIMTEDHIDMQRLLRDSEHLNGFIQPSRRSNVFRSDKTYLLLGGLGSLGPHVVKWMYEVRCIHVALQKRLAEHTDTHVSRMAPVMSPLLLAQFMTPRKTWYKSTHSTCWSTSRQAAGTSISRSSRSTLPIRCR
jgi:hypothetical protein